VDPLGLRPGPAFERELTGIAVFDGCPAGQILQIYAPGENYSPFIGGFCREPVGGNSGVCLRFVQADCEPTTLARNTTITVTGCYYGCIGFSTNLALEDSTVVGGVGTPGVSGVITSGPPSEGVDGAACYWVCGGYGSSGPAIGFGSPGAGIIVTPGESDGGTTGPRTCRPYSPTPEMGGSGCY